MITLGVLLILYSNIIIISIIIIIYYYYYYYCFFLFTSVIITTIILTTIMNHCWTSRLLEKIFEAPKAIYITSGVWKMGSSAGNMI